MASENKINCPNCRGPLNLDINKFNYNEIEFAKIKCQKCSINFCLLFCCYCQKKIFMNIFPNSPEYNGLIGYNIKCPYKSCNNIFYFTVCPKCKISQKIKKNKYIKEGEIITCTNEGCNYQYIEVHMPIEYCTDIVYFEKSKFQTNYPNGIILMPKSGDMSYQKINCNFCFRPIVYFSSKTNRNKYLESQKVECPYEDCQSIFNRLICPFCFTEIIINNGFYQMGSLVKCSFKGCRKSFGKIFCCHCNKMNVCQKKFKIGRMKCGFPNCKKDNNLANCIFCNKLNIFDLNIHLQGRTIKCAYCSNEFNEIICPFCKEINPFPLADFSFGKTYKCQYITCQKEFQFVVCPKCLKYSLNQELVEGQKVKCEICDLTFMNLACPFCKVNLIIYNSSFKIGQMITCPNEECSKQFSFISCSNCQKLIFSNENENLSGKAVKCPYQNCKTYTRSIICPSCKVNIVYSKKKEDFNEGDDITCLNCKKSYKFHVNEEVIIGDITYLNVIQGEKIEYGKGVVDENFLAHQKIFCLLNINESNSSVFSSYGSFNNSINNNCYINKSYKDCMICHNNIKESVFYPCGHRCTCYNCAVIAFSVTKKCPKCQKNAKCIIKKVYE